MRGKVPEFILGQLYRDFFRLVLADSRITFHELKDQLKETPCGRWVSRNQDITFVGVFKRIWTSARDANLITREDQEFHVSPRGKTMLDLDLQKITNTRIDYIEDITGQEIYS